jgi:hypothetical protein
MQKLNQIFLFILSASLFIIQTAAQSNSVNDQTNQDAVPQNILDQYEKSAVRIERHWKLINSKTRKQVYFLYVSVKSLKQKGIRTMSQAEAVPVYVENDSGSYEPVMVEDKGQFNVPVEESFSAGGFVVTTDGFIMTSRRVAAPWHSEMSYEGFTIPPGILMSADLKRISQVDISPPVDWIPSQTKSQRGMIGNLGIKANFNFENTKNEIEFKVLAGQVNKSKEATLVMTSDQQDVGLIKVSAPDQLKALELYDNYDLLKKGSTDNFIVFSTKNGLTIMKKLVNTANSNELGATIQLPDIFGPGEKVREAARAFLRTFGNSSSGNPVFDSHGRVIGIYQSYNASDYTHNVIPIRFGQELLVK